MKKKREDTAVLCVNKNVRLFSSEHGEDTFKKLYILHNLLLLHFTTYL